MERLVVRWVDGICSLKCSIFVCVFIWFLDVFIIWIEVILIVYLVVVGGVEWRVLGSSDCGYFFSFLGVDYSIFYLVFFNMVFCYLVLVLGKYVCFYF